MSSASTLPAAGLPNFEALLRSLAIVLRLFAGILVGYLALQILVWFFRQDLVGPLETLWRAAALLKLALICTTAVGLERAWRLAGKLGMGPARHWLLGCAVAMMALVVVAVVSGTADHLQLYLWSEFYVKELVPLAALSHAWDVLLVAVGVVTYSTAGHIMQCMGMSDRFRWRASVLGIFITIHLLFGFLRYTYHTVSPDVLRYVEEQNLEMLLLASQERFYIVIGMHRALSLGEAILSTWVFLAAWQALRMVRRARSQHCPGCGYDLRGEFEGGCSECGWNL